MNIKEKVNLIDSAIAKASKRNILNPIAINLQEEKNNFFSKKNYSPQFKYDQSKTSQINILEISNFIKQQLLPKELNDYFSRILEDLNNNSLTAELIGSNKFTEYQKKLLNVDFSSVDLKLINSLLELLPEIDNSNVLDSKSIVIKMREAMDRYDFFHDWEIKLTENGRSGVSLFGDVKKITVAKSIRKTESDLKRLIIHEIFSHAIRHVNNEKINLEFIKKGLSPNLMTYIEGHAVFNEFKSKTITYNALKKYINRFLVAKEGNLTFIELYNKALSFGDNNDSAFEFAYRFKRGVSDTSLPLINIKDCLYLYGYSKVSKLDEKIYKFLFSGRVTPDDFILEEFGLIDSSKAVIPSLI